MDTTGATAAEASAVASTKTGVATAEAATAAMPAATTVTSAMLRPERYRQEKRERRDEHQAAHNALL